MLRSVMIAAGVIVYAMPVGNTETLTTRVVTIDGVTGPAYYSPIENGYRFVGGRTLAARDDADLVVSSVETKAPGALLSQ
ncbi:MAG: hypothetical protein KAG89_17875 [Fulvimarina manganoxydans]|uniref:hypothetical protein n=1 Tax=Fulvimarina manganoxydans TaxID=937218 RepID=UPI002357B029|nr:hypothetical protein [Fulvimarina manganoxydans]MCK5934034.1 hypothetical protein [Fulvimarina manganoxydans]